jgi:pyrimidine-specific ribonucleoside hydrolase
MGASEKSASLSEADLHDACAVTWLIDPALIRGVPMFITVELKGEFTRGMTVCDYRHLRGSLPHIDLHREPTMPFRGEPPNAEAGLELNMEGFMRLLCETLSAYP